jgi:hypothetical protein
MPYMIDEPTLWDSLAEWKEHLEGLHRIPEQDAPEVRRAVKRALVTILWIERGQRSLTRELPRRRPP